MRALTILAFTLLCTPAAFAQGVSLARNGACYAADDPYHDGIIPLQRFTTMADCVAAGGWDRRAWGTDPWTPPGAGAPTHGMVYRHAQGNVYQGNVYQDSAQATMGGMMEDTLRGPVQMEGYAATHATTHGSAHGTVYGPTHGAMYGPTNGTVYRSPYGTPQGPTDGPLTLPARDWAPLPAMPSAATREDTNAEAARWMGAPNGCRTVRDDLLARLSRVPVSYSVDGCSVAKGVWVDAAMGITIHDPNAVEVGHVVPPGWAETRGAETWDAGQRAAFYTDPNNLIALSSQGQEARAAQGTGGWRPHSATQACTLAHAFATVVHRHRLDITRADAYALQVASADGCLAPADMWVEGIQLERDGFTHAERTGFDATRGVIRTPKDTAVRFASDGTYTAVPFAADAQGRPIRGVATGNSMVFNPAILHMAPAQPTLAQAFVQETDDIDAGVVMAEKPPIAEPGGRVRTAAPTPPAPPLAPNTGMDTERPDTAPPPPEPSEVYDLTDFNGLRIEEIVNMVNGNTIVRGINDDGQPLNPTVLLQSLGFPPEVINATLQEAFEADDPERANTVPIPPAPPADGAAGNGTESGNTVRSPLGGPEVQTDPNLPPFDGDPMMLGIGAEGAGMSTAP